MNREPTDHLCRHCGIGRIEKIESAHGDVAFWCPNCEVTVANGSVKDLCFCGHKFPSGKRSGLKCVRNPARTPDNPHAILVILDQEQPAPATPKPRATVSFGGDL